MGEPKLLVLPLGGPRASSPRAACRGPIPLATGGRPEPADTLPLQHQLTLVATCQLAKDCDWPGDLNSFNGNRREEILENIE